MSKLLPYVWRQTKYGQLRILLIVLLSFPFYFVSLDLPKQIITNAIQGKIFRETGGQVDVFRLAFDLPDVLSGRHLVIFDGFRVNQLEYLFALSGLFLFLVVLNGFFKYQINIRKGALGERFIQYLRLSLFSKLLTFSPEALRHVKPSEAATILKDEVEPIGGFVGDAFVQPVFLGGQAITAMLFIVLQSLQLGLIAAVIVLVQVVIIPRLRREQMRLGIERQKKQRAFAGKVGEVVECISEVGGQGAAGFERSNVAHRLDDLYMVRFRLFERKFAVKFLNNLLAQVTPFLFYTIGGFYALRGDIDVGQLVAVIAAYRDLPPPLKELIDWDQQRMDVETKFRLVSEQFSLEADGDVPPPVAADAPLLPDSACAIVAQNLGVKSGSGDVLLDRASLSIPAGCHAALLDRGGDGARTFGQVMGRRLSQFGGSLRFGEHNIGDIPPETWGRRIGYVGAEPVIFDGTLHENILYGQSRPGGDAQSPDDAQASRDLNDRQMIAVLRIVGLADSVFGFGLARRIDPARNPGLVDQVVGIRSRLRQKLVELGADSVVEPFDPARYMANGTIGDNIIFGVATDPRFAGAELAAQPFLLDLLDKHGLMASLSLVGQRIAAAMLEMFRDLAPDNVLFERFAFVPAEEFPVFQDILGRTGSGQVNQADHVKLIGLALLYIEPRHRLGLLDDDLKRRILEIRARFRKTAPGEIAAAVAFYDPQVFCAAASLRDNLLFGFVAQGSVSAAERALAAVEDTVIEMGLEAQVYRLGLEQPAGYGGRLLFPATKTAVVLARNLIKQPEVLILNDAFGALGENEARDILARIRDEMRGRTLVVIGRKFDTSLSFDMTATFEGTRLMSVSQTDQANAAAAQASAADGELGPVEQEELQALRSVPLFSHLDIAHLKLLAFTSERVIFADGDVLFRQGDGSDAAFLVLSGTAAVSVETIDGPLVVSTVREKAVVGEMGIITGEPRSATITATSDVTALKVSKDVFLALLAEFPQMALSLTRLMVTRLQDNVAAAGRRPTAGR